MENMAILWLVLLVVFLVAEGMTVAMVSLWFAIGALVSLVAGLLGAPEWLQAVLFFAVSGVMLVLLRPISKKYLAPKTKTNVEAVVGTTGRVTVAVDNDSAVGQVKLGAMEWTARSTSGKVLEVGTLVTVDRIEGVKVFVSEK